MENQIKARMYTLVCKCITVIGILALFFSLNVTPIAKQTFYFVKATGYCPCEICCGKWADGYTAMGDKAGRGCIATDPKGNLHIGWTVYVEGYGFGELNDVGGAIKGRNRIDLCFETHQEALDWGVKYVVLWVIKE